MEGNFKHLTLGTLDYIKIWFRLTRFIDIITCQAKMMSITVLPSFASETQRCTYLDSNYLRASYYYVNSSYIIKIKNKIPSRYFNSQVFYLKHEHIYDLLFPHICYYGRQHIQVWQAVGSLISNPDLLIINLSPVTREWRINWANDEIKEWQPFPQSSSAWGYLSADQSGWWISACLWNSHVLPHSC